MSYWSRFIFIYSAFTFHFKLIYIKFYGSLEIEDSACKFTANSIPNHDFNDGTSGRANPGSGYGSFKIDSHNAHTQVLVFTITM